MPTGIIIIGALGKMGREIAEIVFSDDKYDLRGAVESPDHPCQGEKYAACIGKGECDAVVSQSIDAIDCDDSVCVDFSSPRSLSRLLPSAAKKKCPVVIGTTGLTSADHELIESYSSRIPLLVSPNMSLGINLLFYLTELVTPRLKDEYDIEIIEAHHRFKKDSPSGTAKHLGEIVANSLGQSYNSCVRDGRKGLSSVSRPKNEIGMHAIRGGDIVGDHTVLFAGIGERIELHHMAHSRSTLARGALLAAQWIKEQPSGLYSMRDVLGL